jgi:uncharacterized protein
MTHSLYTHYFTILILLLKGLAIVISVYSISFLFYVDGSIFTVHAQSDLETIKYRNLIIDLGNGVKTNAQLTIPAIGNGPFPVVLLITGSGAENMNETAGYIRVDSNKTGLKIYPPTPFFQIAEYLSDRGFATLRYDKRGIGTNHTILDTNIWGNLTIDDLEQDANKALSVLMQQPEVDNSKITVLGHSEGTVITPTNSILHLNGKLAKGQYKNMSWLIFIHGLNLILGLQIPLLFPPPHHPYLLRLEVKVSSYRWM